jgi:hypothetical protein
VRPSFLGQLFQWVWVHVADFFHALFGRVHVAGGALSIAGIAIVVVCVLALIAVSVSLALRLQLERTRASRVAPIAPVRSAQAYANDAARAAAQGDYARAVRALFIAAVVSLDVNGMVADDSGATVNELRRALAMRHAGLVPAFSDIARAYTSAAYAEMPLDRDAYERASSAYAQIEAGLAA